MAWVPTTSKSFAPGVDTTEITYQGVGDHSHYSLWKNNYEGWDHEGAWIITNAPGLYMEVTIGPAGTTESISPTGDTYNNEGVSEIYDGLYPTKYLWYDGGQWIISDIVGADLQEQWEEDSEPEIVIRSGSGTLTRTVSWKSEITRVTGDNGSVSESWTPDDPGDDDGSGTWEITYSTSGGGSCTDMAILIYGSQYTGDSWWCCPTLEGRYLPRGQERGRIEHGYQGTYYDITWSAEGWLRQDGSGSDAPYGEYVSFLREVTIEETDDTDDDITDWYISETLTIGSGPGITVGDPYWADGNGTEYIKSVEADINGEHSYGDVYYNTSNWVIGVEDSEAGWYEGDEPPLNNSITFTGKKTATGSLPSPSSLTLSFSGYKNGGEYSDVRVAEIAQWLER